MPQVDARRIEHILATLDRTFPDAAVALRADNPVQLLVATILSAQCTDERVNQVTPALFARFPNAAALASADQGELEALIHSTGFFRNKAKAIRGCCQKLVAQHGGHVPDSMEEMTALPGVARKTANVVLGTAMGIASGVVVDTHVKRVSQRLGLSAHTDPVRIERDLMALIPRAQWIRAGHQILLHGRHVCQARQPHCDACLLAADCPSRS